MIGNCFVFDSSRFFSKPVFLQTICFHDPLFHPFSYFCCLILSSFLYFFYLCFPLSSSFLLLSFDSPFTSLHSFHSCFKQTPQFLKYQSIAISLIHLQPSSNAATNHIASASPGSAASDTPQSAPSLSPRPSHRYSSLLPSAPHCEQSGCTCIISTRKLRLISSSLAHRSTPRMDC